MCLYAFLPVQQTTKEISVWLTVNLCTILYICITMVFMYTLLVAHESIFDHDTVLFFESLLLAVNGNNNTNNNQVILFNNVLTLFSISFFPRSPICLPMVPGVRVFASTLSGRSNLTRRHHTKRIQQYSQRLIHGKTNMPKLKNRQNLWNTYKNI